MKRFWQDVAVTAEGGIALDGRPVRTPGRLALVAPFPALAEGIAAEWRAVGEDVDPRAMPLTGLANAAIERIAPDAPTFAGGIAVYGGSDLLCYRAEPGPLAERQAAAWDPVLEWARDRHGVDFVVTGGVMPVEQPPRTLARLREAVVALSPWELAPLSPIVSLTGSLLLGLAIVERAIDADSAWAAAHVDEDWQAEQWGEDSLAAETRAAHAADYRAAVRFLDLIRA
ncbi:MULTISPECIES: ATP12 family chaperone protein [unclassified Sphingomonas]|uniref:ATP12 family chaperone protein n=1 Tax=unclassified Sphingomonas TaxID=196159 RepID=UPI0006F3AD39|nr:MULTISPECIES: ATP12 family protein [unclassified Sphingomonas]KQM62464.1 ATPase [Sphingomonas sp. Leaf16]KQN13887.1 ATPase [Sphingomonas sp. Leaf29]KQN23853.1 ATPase [Sphingomonas sp. Leaf32]